MVLNHMANVENIAIWAAARTGSTYLQQVLARGLWDTYGANTRNLSEVTGVGGFIPDWPNRPKVDFGAAVDEENTDTPTIQVFHHWEINKYGLLIQRAATGDPIEEVHRRAKIIKQGRWENNVVFKNVRWGTDSRFKNRLDNLYDDAILNSNKNFHHVVIWRRNALDTLHSWMVLKNTKMIHGKYEWDGVPIEHQGNVQAFHKSYMATQKDFIDALNKLDHLKTVIIETDAISSLRKLDWFDGNHILLKDQTQLGDNSKAKKYINKYINESTGEEIRPVDMLSESAKKIAADIAYDMECQFKWSELDLWMGFKCYA
jgi:hypothetical protein